MKLKIDANAIFPIVSCASMKLTVVLVLLVIIFGGSKSSLETILNAVFEKPRLDVPTGRSVCFFDLGWDQAIGLQVFAMKSILNVSITNFDLQSAYKFVDVSGICAINIVLLGKKSNLADLFKCLSFDKYSMFVITNSESEYSLNIARIFLKQGITNVLFLEQIGSSVKPFVYNLQLTERIAKSMLDPNLFCDKLSKLDGYPFSVLTLLPSSLR